MSNGHRGNTIVEKNRKRKPIKKSLGWFAKTHLRCRGKKDQRGKTVGDSTTTNSPFIEQEHFLCLFLIHKEIETLSGTIKRIKMCIEAKKETIVAFERELEKLALSINSMNINTQNNQDNRNIQNSQDGSDDRNQNDSKHDKYKKLYQEKERRKQERQEKERQEKERQEKERKKQEVELKTVRIGHDIQDCEREIAKLRQAIDSEIEITKSRANQLLMRYQARMQAYWDGVLRAKKGSTSAINFKVDLSMQSEDITGLISTIIAPDDTSGDENG